MVNLWVVHFVVFDCSFLALFSFLQPSHKIIHSLSWLGSLLVGQLLWEVELLLVGLGRELVEVGQQLVRLGQEELVGVGKQHVGLGQEELVGVGQQLVGLGQEGLVGLGQQHVGLGHDELVGVGQQLVGLGQEELVGIGQQIVRLGQEELVGMGQQIVRLGQEELVGVGQQHVGLGHDELVGVGQQLVGLGQDELVGMGQQIVRLGQEELVGVGVVQQHVGLGQDELVGVGQQLVGLGQEGLVRVGKQLVGLAQEELVGVGRQDVGHGQLLEEVGRQLVGRGQLLEEVGRQLVGCGQLLEEVGRQLVGRGQLLEEVGRQLVGRGQLLERQLVGRGQLLEEVGRQLLERGQQLVEVGRQLVGVGRQLQQLAVTGVLHRTCGGQMARFLCTWTHSLHFQLLPTCCMQHQTVRLHEIVSHAHHGETSWINVLVVHNLCSESWRKCDRGAVIYGTSGGGNEIITIPFVLPYSTASNVLWLSWPSRRSRCFALIEQFVTAWKWCNHLKKRVWSMYPVPLTFTPPMAPAGAPCIKISWNLFRGNMIIGGRKLPAAFMQQSAVVFFPRSADDALRTCLTPFVATTFPGCTTVVIPVSSQFQMLVALKLPLWRVSSNTSKNPFTAFSVKLLMQARLVAMGFLMVNAPLRCMNPRSQSFPANPCVVVKFMPYMLPFSEFICQPTHINGCDGIHPSLH